LPTVAVAGDLEAGRLIDPLRDWRPTRWIVHAVFPSRRGLLPSGSYNSALLRAAQGMTREGVELVEGAIRGIPLYDGDGEQEEGGSRRGQKVLFRLSSRRAYGDRLILDEAKAQHAFAWEVAVCLVDPHIRALAKRRVVRD